MPIPYKGENEVLKELSASNITPESFTIIKVVTPERYKKLEEKGTTKEVLWDQMVGWMTKSPEPIKSKLDKWADGIDFLPDSFLLKHYVVEGEGEAQARFAAVIGELSIEEIDDFIYEEPEWFAKAPRIVKGIVKMMREYTPNPGAPYLFGDLIESILEEIKDNNYIK